MSMLIVCILMVLFISINVGVLCFIGYQLTKELKFKRMLDEKKLLFTLDENGITDVLENLINESVTKYQLINFNDGNTEYISGEMQKIMLSSVLQEVLNNISPVILEKLSIMYNRSKIEDIVYFKVNMAILNYVIEINGTYSSN